jgi:spore maturation protein CgeB
MSDIVILGLSVTSSWGNGHATTYRSLIRGLAARGHRILFLERDVPWYADNRDLPQSPEAEVRLYDNLSDLKDGYERQIAEAALVIVGSFVPEGIEVGEWVTSVARGVTGFYDIDTPVTIEKLESSSCEYLSSDLIPHYDLYLSFTGGPMLKRIEKDYGSPMVVSYTARSTRKTTGRWKARRDGISATWVRIVRIVRDCLNDSY